MATTLWGNVYYKDVYAGRLQEEPSGRVIFTYDASYLESKHPGIAYTLPLQSEGFICEHGLHPFFDNLVAEGWFQKAQAKALGIDPKNRFGLLLGFGFDLAGWAVREGGLARPAGVFRGHLDDRVRESVSSRGRGQGVERLPADL